MSDVFLLDYVRTPRAKGSARGSLHHQSPVDLVAALQRALVDRTGLDPGAVEDVIVGSASQVDEQGANLARTATLLAGWGDGVPGGTINRFCASGVDAVAQTSARIRAGDIGLAVAGGVESVSRVPMYSDRGPLWTHPETVRRIGSIHMGVAADLNATIDGWTRDQLDAYAVETHTKAAAAWDRGDYAGSVLPMTRADGSVFDRDELIRPGTTAESLKALAPAFGDLGQDPIALAAHPEVGEINHLHTVGSSPALADGAALLLLGTRAQADRHGLRPRARVLASATAAVDPVIMLTAGQEAIEKVLAKAGLTPADIDVYEFAEAFSALCLRLRRDLGPGPDRLNPGGGTIAMGHAFGATGAIMVGGCADALERLGGRYGVAAVSGAAGLGVAVLIERVTEW
ncbi:acetyl-CoA C-acetyltransferase [Acrocarpospora macrocephala]|uniref:Acetyl-CoA acetyltransferase n=1 Tax=Acrocarpospora macrocephala TaxID=150177 RepID=A0A5M3WCN5_9ACTN|nr:acetyl-CoA C-acyltransferase [Acrocarpospora macrocephala]GES06825.1 acetyl-CoA acetyltransferase [Acrocarpospora macrocephala]